MNDGFLPTIWKIECISHEIPEKAVDKMVDIFHAELTKSGNLLEIQNSYDKRQEFFKKYA